MRNLICIFLMFLLYHSTAMASNYIVINNVVPISSRTQANDDGGTLGLSDGVNLGSLINFSYTAEVNGNGIRPCVSNTYGYGILATVGQAETSGPNAITVEWGIWTGASFTQGTFAGSNSYSLAAGQYLCGDFINIPVVKGTIYDIALRTTVTSGQKYPCAFAQNVQGGAVTNDWQNIGVSDGAAIPAITTQLTSSTTWTSTPYSMMPISVQTTQTASLPPPTVSGWGDSIGAGAIDQPSADNPGGFLYPGWLRKTVKAAGSLPISYSLASDSALENVYPGMAKRLLWYPYASHSIIAYGTNDLGGTNASATLAEANMTEIANVMAAQGQHPALASVMPRVNTGDTNWYTAPSTQVSWTNHTNRELFYAWEKTLPSPFVQYLDLYNAVSSGLDTDKWGNAGHVNVTATGGSTTTATFTVPAGTLSGAHDQLAIQWLTGSNANTWCSVASSVVSGTTITDTCSATQSNSVVSGNTAWLWTPYTVEGTHPSRWGTNAIVAALTSTVASWINSNY